MGFTTGITGIAVNGFTGLMGWMGLGWEKKGNDNMDGK
jgi:hypothetical protein